MCEEEAQDGESYRETIYQKPLEMKNISPVAPLT